MTIRCSSSIEFECSLQEPTYNNSSSSSSSNNNNKIQGWGMRARDIPTTTSNVNIPFSPPPSSSVKQLLNSEVRVESHERSRHQSAGTSPGGTCTVNPNKLTPFIFKKNN